MDAAEKSDRLIEAASAALNAAPNRRLNAVVLNKVLFYFDLATLRDRGSTITNNTYIGIQQGPVVAKYPQRLIGQLEARGIGKQISEWDGSKPVLLETTPEHFHYLDCDALVLLSSVVSFFSSMTSRQASDYSHENSGWQLAWNEFRRTGRPCAINLHIAMQQIVEEDPWLDLPLMSADEALALADAAMGAEW